MRTPLPGLVLRTVRRTGGEHVAALINKFKLPEDTEHTQTIVSSVATLHAFYEEAAVLLDDPCLGLHMASLIERGAYGLVEFSIRSAPNVREALTRLVRFITLINEAAEVTLSEANDEGRCDVRVPGRAIALGRHSNEFFIAILLTQARQLSGSPCVPRRVWFAHARPERSEEFDEYVKTFGTTKLAFGRGSNGFALERSYLDASLSSFDPALLAAVDGHVEKLLNERPVTHGLLAEVREMIRQGLREGAPTLALVATIMNLSPRTLQRRLSEEDTSFQRELDHVREELARVYLADRNLPLDHVAYLLGYTEMAAFRRAFKRWTGQDPRELSR